MLAPTAVAAPKPLMLRQPLGIPQYRSGRRANRGTARRSRVASADRTGSRNRFGAHDVQRPHDHWSRATANPEQPIVAAPEPAPHYRSRSTSPPRRRPPTASIRCAAQRSSSRARQFSSRLETEEASPMEPAPITHRGDISGRRSPKHPPHETHDIHRDLARCRRDVLASPLLRSSPQASSHPAPIGGNLPEPSRICPSRTTKAPYGDQHVAVPAESRHSKGT